MRIWLGLLLICGYASATELGRLFFTPQERMQMERQLAPAGRINGVVQKQGGGTTVWLNGKRYQGAALPPRQSDRTAELRIKREQP